MEATTITTLTNVISRGSDSSKDEGVTCIDHCDITYENQIAGSIPAPEVVESCPAPPATEEKITSAEKLKIPITTVALSTVSAIVDKNKTFNPVTQETEATPSALLPVATEVLEI